MSYLSAKAKASRKNAKDLFQFPSLRTRIKRFIKTLPRVWITEDIRKTNMAADELPRLRIELNKPIQFRSLKRTSNLNQSLFAKHLLLSPEWCSFSRTALPEP